MALTGKPAGRRSDAPRTGGRISPIGVVELPDFDRGLVEVVEQACVDAHLTGILAEGPPVRSASARRAVMDADHPVTPDVSRRFSSDGDLVRREIGDAPRELSTERAIAVGHPRGLVRNFDLHLAAMAAAMNAHAGQ